MVEISLSGSGEGPGWETSRPTLQMGSGLPSRTILGLCVVRARMAASRFMVAPIHVGVL